MGPKNQKIKILMGVISGIAVFIFFQNCSQYYRNISTSKLSLPSVTANVTPVLVTDPVIIPADTKSDVLTKMQINLGAKGNSTCQMQPPVIPDFEQASDGSNVIKVCATSKCPYQSITQALDKAVAGTIIAVAAGTYEECLRVYTNDITIQGRGGRPLLRASGCQAAPWSGAVIGVYGDNLKLENLEITDPTAQTVIAVGVAKSGLNLTMNNLYIHDMPGGLYTVDAGNVVITNNYLDHVGWQNGTDPHTAPALSIGIGTKTAVIKNSIIAHPQHNGGMLTTTASKSTVDCVIAADLEGGISPYLVSFGWGFDSTITNSVLQRGPLSTPQMLLYWERNAQLPEDQFTAKNNIFISDRDTRDREMLDFRAATPTTYLNNIFVGPNSSGYANFPNSKAYESRAAAGFSKDVLPYPGSM